MRAACIPEEQEGEQAEDQDDDDRHDRAAAAPLAGVDDCRLVPHGIVVVPVANVISPEICGGWDAAAGRRVPGEGG